MKKIKKSVNNCWGKGKKEKRRKNKIASDGLEEMSEGKPEDGEYFSATDVKEGWRSTRLRGVVCRSCSVPNF